MTNTAKRLPQRIGKTFDWNPLSLEKEDRSVRYSRSPGRQMLRSSWPGSAYQMMAIIPSTNTSDGAKLTEACGYLAHISNASLSYQKRQRQELLPSNKYSSRLRLGPP